ncbi:MAG TPA: hypothetical protein VNR40_18330 [Steroidobacter sp.]|nr:hypothetical protein [Steroidobacter sp.]
MSAITDALQDTKVYATAEGRAVIEQLSGSVVLEAEQILTVIEQLHACYDYCAVWNQPPQE